MLRKVLVTLDGSDLSEKALSYAQEITPDDAELILLTVVDLPDISAYSLYPLSVSMDYYSDALSQAESGAVDYIEKVAAPLREKGYTVQAVVATGIAADTIVEQAKQNNVQAIIMSTHGRTGINQWLFGSVTQKVLSMMPCPVLVVPGRQPDRSVSND